MKSLLMKEFKLAASPLAYIFLAGALMTLLPGYPILMGAFFICFGVFHSFQVIPRLSIERPIRHSAKMLFLTGCSRPPPIMMPRATFQNTLPYTASPQSQSSK